MKMDFWFSFHSPIYCVGGVNSYHLGVHQAPPILGRWILIPRPFQLHIREPAVATVRTAANAPAMTAPTPVTEAINVATVPIAAPPASNADSLYELRLLSQIVLPHQWKVTPPPEP